VAWAEAGTAKARLRPRVITLAVRVAATAAAILRHRIWYPEFSTQK
jgi:hypothetical protein